MGWEGCWHLGVPSGGQDETAVSCLQGKGMTCAASSTPTHILTFCFGVTQPGSQLTLHSGVNKIEPGWAKYMAGALPLYSPSLAPY